MNDFRDLLENYGADPDALLSFEKAGPDLLPYATLLGARGSDPDLAVLHGVYEWQRSPLIFFLNGDELGDDSDRLRRVRRMLALRGDAPYLGVVKPGQLTLYRLSLDAEPPEKALIPLPGGDQRATLADLYDPLTMPPQLLKAHQALDRAVDAAYGRKSFASEAERVAFLFGRYQALTSLLPKAKAKASSRKRP